MISVPLHPQTHDSIGMRLSLRLTWRRSLMPLLILTVDDWPPFEFLDAPRSCFVRKILANFANSSAWPVSGSGSSSHRTPGSSCRNPTLNALNDRFQGQRV